MKIKLISLLLVSFGGTAAANAGAMDFLPLYILERQKQLDQLNQHRNNFIAAAKCNRLCAMEAILSDNAFASCGGINSRDEDQRTLLMRFALEGNEQAVKLLLENGALLYCKDSYGKTVLDYCKATEGGAEAREDRPVVTIRNAAIQTLIHKEEKKRLEEYKKLPLWKKVFVYLYKGL